MSNVNRIWGVMRVVDGELCFLGEGDCFAPLDDRTYFYGIRNDAYEVAQSTRGLLCCITKELAKGYALTSKLWIEGEPTASADCHALAGA